jgi:hypothetical protein
MMTAMRLVDDARPANVGFGESWTAALTNCNRPLSEVRE